MKNSVIILLLVCNFLSAQQIKDTIRVKIPYIGQNGGAYSLGWSLNEKNDKLYLYTYSHINGYQLIASPEEIKEARNRYKDKSWFGRFIENATRLNGYQFAIMPVVAETRIKLSNKNKSNNIEVFHKMEDLPEGKNVYFIEGNSGMISLGNIPFYAGSYLKYHYKSINNVFSHTPKIPNEVLKFLIVTNKGEGMLGIKNMKPIIERRKAEFIYDDVKGFYTKTEKLIEKDLSKYIDISQYSYISQSSNIQGEASVSWFTDNKNIFLYSYYDGKLKNDPEIRKYEFDNSREIKVLNQKIFNKDMTPYGFLSIFGYNKKQDKNKRKYDENEYDIIITDLEGKEVHRKLIRWGDKDNYKHSLRPLQIFYENGKLKIMNVQGMFRLKYELLEYNIDEGILKKEEFSGIPDLKDYAYLNNATYSFGDKKVFIKNFEDNLDTKNIKSPKVNAGFKVLVIDNDYNIIDKSTFKDVLKSKNGKEEISYQKILLTEKELVLLANQGSSYYLIKINEEGKINAQRIKTPFEETSENKVYFGYNNLKPVLVDNENRLLYLLNQYYYIVGNDIRILDEVGISVVSF